MKRQVFYSFYYKPDNVRASQVRNMGVVEGTNQLVIMIGNPLLEKGILLYKNGCSH